MQDKLLSSPPPRQPSLQAPPSWPHRTRLLPAFSATASLPDVLRPSSHSHRPHFSPSDEAKRTKARNRGLRSEAQARAARSPEPALQASLGAAPRAPSPEVQRGLAPQFGSLIGWWPCRGRNPDVPGALCWQCAS